MTLSELTVSKIKKLTNDFFKNAIFAEARNVEDMKKAYPFHAAFFEEEALIAALNERSIVTKMGQIFYPKLAKIVAEDKYHEVKREYIISGEVEISKLQTIDRILTELRGRRKRDNGMIRRPKHNSEMQEIISSTGGDTQIVQVTADLYVGDFKDGPLFMEIKSPMPNLDVCYEAKQEILLFKTILAGKNPQAYFAFPYNPFIKRERYAHSFTKRIMDLEKEVLMGKEMWNLLGDNGAYEEILRIIGEISVKKWKERGKQKSL